MPSVGARRAPIDGVTLVSRFATLLAAPPYAESGG